MPDQRLAFGGENRLGKATGKCFDDLRDVRNLFVGGEDEGSECFPRVLPQKPKPAAARQSVLQRRVRRKLAGDFAKVNLYLEIALQKIPVGFGMACGEEEAFCVGKGSDPMILNDADPLALAAAPAKSLAAAERFSQVVVCGGKLAGLQAVGGLGLRFFWGKWRFFSTSDDASDGRLKDFFTPF